MKVKFIIGLVAIAIVSACSIKKTVVPTVDVPTTAIVKEKFVVTAETLTEGKSLYGMHCAKCHKLYDKESFSAAEWTPIMLSMQKKAKISDVQRETIYAYLTTL